MSLASLGAERLLIRPPAAPTNSQRVACRPGTCRRAAPAASAKLMIRSQRQDTTSPGVSQIFAPTFVRRPSSSIHLFYAMANASQCPPSAVTAPAPAAADKAVVAVPPLSVSQLDTAQVARASKALLHHMRLLAADHTEKSHKKSLLGDADADADAAALQDPIFIVLATKKFLEDRTRLVPVKMCVFNRNHVLGPCN